MSVDETSRAGDGDTLITVEGSGAAGASLGWLRRGLRPMLGSCMAAVVLGISALGLSACGAATSHGSLEQARRPVEGRTIFSAYCARCHTLTGHDTRAPAGDLGFGRLTKDQVASFVRIMPVARSLSRWSILAVAAYVARFQRGYERSARRAARRLVAETRRSQLATLESVAFGPVPRRDVVAAQVAQPVAGEPPRSRIFVSASSPEIVSPSRAPGSAPFATSLKNHSSVVGPPARAIVTNGVVLR